VSRGEYYPRTDTQQRQAVVIALFSLIIFAAQESDQSSVHSGREHLVDFAIAGAVKRRSPMLARNENQIGRNLVELQRVRNQCSRFAHWSDDHDIG
jgi:hypothetical protein